MEKGGKAKVSRLLGVPPNEDGEGGDEDLFEGWGEYLRLEKESGVGAGEGGLVEVEAEA